MSDTKTKCAVCGTGGNAFKPLNPETVSYSGIEIAIADGMLRARIFDANGGMLAQDIVNIPFCPLCGRKFDRK